MGPRDAIVVCIPDNDDVWMDNVDPDIEAEILEFIKFRYLRQVALGVDGAYVMLSTRGAPTWNLRGKYPQLDRILGSPETQAKRVRVCTPCSKFSLGITDTP